LKKRYVVAVVGLIPIRVDEELNNRNFISRTPIAQRTDSSVDVKVDRTESGYAVSRRDHPLRVNDRATAKPVVRRSNDEDLPRVRGDIRWCPANHRLRSRRRTDEQRTKRGDSCDEGSRHSQRS
jgi:hypothetical protein